jgi:hypothetical protein
MRSLPFIARCFSAPSKYLAASGAVRSASLARRRLQHSRGVGLAMRAERKVIDKIVDGLKFHS